jgi:hypothetical protein
MSWFENLTCCFVFTLEFILYPILHYACESLVFFSNFARQLFDRGGPSVDNNVLCFMVDNPKCKCTYSFLQDKVLPQKVIKPLSKLVGFVEELINIY